MYSWALPDRAILKLQRLEVLHEIGLLPVGEDEMADGDVVVATASSVAALPSWQ